MNDDNSWAPIREYSAGTRNRRFPWAGAVVLVVILGLMAWYMVPRYLEMRRTTQEKAIQANVYRCLATTDHFFAEYPDRLFVRYDEIAGPNSLFKESYRPEVGEDYAALFPIRRDHHKLAVKTVDGRTVVWFAHDDPDGKPARHAVNEWPNGELVGSTEVLKAYRQFLEQERIDGVHLKHFSDGSRFETAYRDGVPHGSFKAFYPDGKLWGEATYENGRVTGPCWNHPREGARFDEMNPAISSQALKNVP